MEAQIAVSFKKEETKVGTLQLGTLHSHSQYLATLSCILKTHNLVALANVLDYTAIQFFMEVYY